MIDLTHWDFAEQFSAHNAAALILGFEPRDSLKGRGRVKVRSRSPQPAAHSPRRIGAATEGRRRGRGAKDRIVAGVDVRCTIDDLEAQGEVEWEGVVRS